MSSAPNPAFGVREGDVLAGKYRIDKVLGTGGMGVVVAAHHLQLDDRVAIKFLHPESLENKDTVARFAREARAAVRIKSEHVARVIDVGTLESGAPYMVMEYLDGSDLQSVLDRTGPLSVEQASEFVLQACEAIAEAHAIGIVHRDLKPENLFLIRRPDDSPSVKVLDFGISKARAAVPQADSTTSESTLIGSPLYMSPEQLRSARDVDGRSDIWALGVVLFELLSGAQPFTAPTMPELVTRILSGTPDALATFRSDVPVGIEDVIARCLQKDREQRFAHVGELAAALLPFAPIRSRASVDRITGVMKKAKGTVARPVTSAKAAPPDSIDTLSEAGAPAAPAGAVRRPLRPAIVALGLTLLVAAAVAAIVAILPSAEPISRPEKALEPTGAKENPVPELIPRPELTEPTPPEERPAAVAPVPPKPRTAPAVSHGTDNHGTRTAAASSSSKKRDLTPLFTERR